MRRWSFRAPIGCIARCCPLQTLAAPNGRSTRSPHFLSADLELLALFQGNNNAPGADASAGSSCGAHATEASNTVVMGQVLAAPAIAQPALAVPAAAPTMPAAVPTDAVQQLQFQAVMQHQAAIMQNPQAYPAAAQMYQQAVLAQQQQVAMQRHMLAQQQAAVALPPMPMPPPALLSKRGKTQQEVEEQTERIKKRRRESAQRRCVRRGAGRESGWHLWGAARSGCAQGVAARAALPPWACYLRDDCHCALAGGANRPKAGYG